MKLRSLFTTLILSLATASALLAAPPLQIMPMGDSITKGAVDPAPTLAGYRARLFDLLNQANANYLFVGSTTTNSNDKMKAAGQQYHNGYGSWRMDALRVNLDGVEQPWGDENMGGYWMVGGTGAMRQPVYPDIVLLLAGTNDLGSSVDEPTLEKRMTDLLQWFFKNRPKTHVFVGTVPPRGLDKPGFETYNHAAMVFNDWIKKKVPAGGNHYHVVDLCSLFLDAKGKVKMPDSPDGICLIDGIHPSHNGYVAMGDAWFKAIKPLLTYK